MSSVESTVAERLESVRRRIREACERGGRDPGEVTLLGIGKRQPIERVRAAVAAGLRVLGENQVQEAVAKSAELPVDLEWHFVGHLQSNKAKPAVRLFDVIHSVDRPKIARKIDLEAARQGRRIEGMIEVNLGGEASKHGFAVAGLFEAIRPLADLEHLHIVGLMAIPPYEEDLDSARRWFRQLRELRDEMAVRPEWDRSPRRGADGTFPGSLSMGMSHDFEAAIEEGATHVRVGTAIFGARPT